MAASNPVGPAPTIRTSVLFSLICKLADRLVLRFSAKFFSKKLMLGFANHEDWARRVSHHLFSDASKPEMFYAAVTVSGNDDEVSSDFVRDVINLQRGL